MNVDKTKARYPGSLKGVLKFHFDPDWSEIQVSSLGVILSRNEKEHLNLKEKDIEHEKLKTAGKVETYL